MIIESKFPSSDAAWWSVGGGELATHALILLGAVRAGACEKHTMHAMQVARILTNSEVLRIQGHRFDL